MLSTHAKTEAKCIFVVLKLYCCYCFDGTAIDLPMIKKIRKKFFYIQDFDICENDGEFSVSTRVR
jgi:hypothetical protein